MKFKQRMLLALLKASLKAKVAAPPKSDQALKMAAWLAAGGAGLWLAARAWRAASAQDLRGQNVLITGGSRGLGLELARELQEVQRGSGVAVTEPRVLGLTVPAPPGEAMTVAQAQAQVRREKAAARPPRRRRVWSAVAAVVSALVVVAAALVLLTRDDPLESPAASFAVGPEPGPVSATEEAVWVLGESSGEAADARLRRVDPETGDVLAAIDVPGAHDVLVVDGSVWVSGDDRVRSIDADTNRIVDDVSVPAAGPLAATDDALWVGSRLDGTITEVDLTSADVVGSVDVGDTPVALAGTGQVLWVLQSGPNTVVRVDGDTGRVTTTVPVQGVVATALAASNEAVWVDNGDELVRLDPATAEIVTRTGFGSTEVATDDAGAWLTAANHGTAELIAPGDDQVSRSVRVPDPRHLAVTDEHVWVTSFHGPLSRIDR